jgi:hypothetical protein
MNKQFKYLLKKPKGVTKRLKTLNQNQRVEDRTRGEKVFRIQHGGWGGFSQISEFKREKKHAIK